MSSQIIFFEKSASDYQYPNVTATASEGNDYAQQALNRNNTSAWITTGSLDANNTTWQVDLVDSKVISEILLIKHNFKNFSVKYWNGSGWVNFSPAINVVNNTAATNYYPVTSVACSKIQITISATQVTNDDKFLYQFIATNKLGKLENWPVIKRPVHNRNKVITKMLSGKSNISENIGAFSCDLEPPVWKSNNDLSLIETLYSSNEGFLVWLCGGDETQFQSKRIGYRLEDIYLMKTANNYQPEWFRGVYTVGINSSISLIEVDT